MFRVLTDEEAKRVVRWQAPDLKGTVPVASTRQVAKPVHLGARKTSRDKPNDLDDLDDLTIASATMGQSAETLTARTTPQTANVPMSGQSADMLQTSYDDGYARGFAEGNSALHQQSVNELQELLNALAKPALKVPDAELEQEVMALSMEIARLVLKREVQMDGKALAALVQRGMEHLPNAVITPVEVRLHPLDARLLEDVAEMPDNVDVVEDLASTRGSCRIRYAASTIHAGVDDWLELMGAELGLSPTRNTQD